MDVMRGGAVAGEVYAQVKTYQVPITNSYPLHLVSQVRTHDLHWLFNVCLPMVSVLLRLELSLVFLEEERVMQQ